MNSSLSSKTSPKKLQKSKKTYKKDEVEEILSSAISSGQKVASSVNSLLSCCVSDSEEPQRRAVFEGCIKALNKELLSTSESKEVTGKLLFEVDKLQGDTLIALAELVVQGVKDGLHQALELLPKFLSAISSKKTIKYKKDDGRTGETSGPTEKSHLLNSLCGCRWSPDCVQHIALVCQEIPMDDEELQFLLEKILRMMKTLKVSELPPLVYQLLVLSGKGHRNMVLEGIKVLFYQLDVEVLAVQEEVIEDSEVTKENRMKELLQTEGTVILHIISALKQDPDLRKEFTKSLKVSQARLSADSLSTFSLALTLSMIRMHIFEDVVFSFLKEVVLKTCKEEERKRTSQWMRDIYVDAPDVEKLFLDTVKYSVIGRWDHVVEGLFTAGLLIMEHFGPKSSASSSSPQYRACCLGNKILRHTFKVHPMVRQELFSQLLNRILTNASSYAGHYIRLLSDVVEQNQQVDMQCLTRLKDAFSSLSLLPPSLALQLLRAVLPLLQFSISLRDSLLLVLRKSLFSRKIESRKVAVGAYLLLLQHFTVLDSVGTDSQFSISSSQSMLVSAEVHGTSSTGHQTANQVLCLEILGILRRALTKQSDVRASLYEGLQAAFFVNPKLSEPILELLLGQFERYYDSSKDAIPPVKLDVCVAVGESEVILLEPLAVLVHSLQSCVTKYFKWKHSREEGAEGNGIQEEEDIPDGVESAHGMLRSAVSRMIKCEPEDFELDKASDFSSGSSVGQKNRHVAALVMGLYETLMEFTFISGEFSQESCEQTLKLYQCYKRISDIMQEKGGVSGGASSSRKASTSGGGAASATSQLSLECTVQLLKALFDDLLPNHQQSMSVLRESQFFTKYVVTVALQKIRQVRDADGWGEGVLMSRPERQFKLCCRLARIMFKQVEASASRVMASKKDKGKSVFLMCLEGFLELLQIVILRQRHWQLQSRSKRSSRSEPMTLVTFLAVISSTGGVATQSMLAEKIQYFIRIVQRLVVAVVDGSLREWSMKDAVTMLSVISTLADQLDEESTELSAVYEWIYSLCKDKSIEDIQVVKSLVALLLSLNCRVKGSVKTLVKVTRDIHYHLGDIDEDMELESTPHFAVVNRQTAPSAVLATLYSHFEWALTDADWLVTRLKTELAQSPVDDVFELQRSPVRTQQQEFCSSLCNRLLIMLTGLNELVQTLLAAGPNTDGLLKVVTQFYTVVGNLTKYCIPAFQETGIVLPSFKKLISAIGSNLSQQVYCFLTFIQTTQPQPESGAGASSKSKKGKGKNKSNVGATSRSKSIVRKETKYFPTLIFSIEQFEKNLILLGKKAKENLMESFKRSMARDFRIDLRAVESALNEGEEEEEDMKDAATNEEDNNQEENGAEIVTVGDSDDEESHSDHSKPPASKRLKRS